MSDTALLNAGFYDLEMGVADVAVGFTDGAADVQLTLQTALVPTSDGAPIGDVVEQGIKVKMVQLELAPREDLLYPNYNYDDPDDPSFPAYCDALNQRGERLDALHVLPANKQVIVQGKALPVFLVYDDPVQFAAMRKLGRAEAKIIIEFGRHPGELLMTALSRVQHAHRPSVLDLCDVAARLDAYGYDQDDIATHMSRDSETGERLTQPTISKMIAVSKLPEPVRFLITTGKILLSHAKLLAQRLGHDDENATALAQWVAQPPRKTVNQLTEALNMCFPPAGKPTGHIQVHANGSVDVIDDAAALRLASERKGGPTQAPAYPTLTPIAAGEILRRTKHVYTGVRVYAEQGHVYVAPESYTGLLTWLDDAKGQPVDLHEVEVVALGLVEALRRAAKHADLVASDGTLAPTIEKETVLKR